MEVINSSEELAKKPVYSTEAYMGYRISALKSPYEYDFEKEYNEQHSENWYHGVSVMEADKIIMENQTGASYLLGDLSDWAAGYFEETGFKKLQIGKCTLYYFIESADH